MNPISAKPVQAPDPVFSAATAAKSAATPLPAAAASATTGAPVSTDAAAPPRLTALVRQMAATPPVDVDRVAMIRRAIADGNFPINPAKIADRLIALRLGWSSHDAS